jgi:hypothetical protein
MARHFGWATRVCWQLSIPLVVSCVFFSMIYFTMDSVTKDTNTSAQIAKTMGDRVVRRHSCKRLALARLSHAWLGESDILCLQNSISPWLVPPPTSLDRISGHAVPAHGVFASCRRCREH